MASSARNSRHPSIARTAIIAGVMALSCLSTASRGQESRSGIGISYSRDGNVSRSSTSTRTSDDIIGVRAFRDIPLEKSSSGWVARLGANAHVYRDFSDLSYFAASVSLDRRWWDLLPVEGSFVDALASAQVRQYANSTIRNGILWSAGGRLGQTLGRDASAAIGLTWDRRVAWEGEVYDLSSWRWQLDLEGRPADAILAYGAAAWISGQDVFTTLSTAVAGSRSRGQTASDPAVGRRGLDFTAIRADATARIFELGIQWAARPDDLIDLRYTRYSADGTGGLSYEGQLWTVGYVHRFR